MRLASLLSIAILAACLPGFRIAVAFPTFPGSRADAVDRLARWAGRMREPGDVDPDEWAALQELVGAVRNIGLARGERRRDAALALLDVAALARSHPEASASRASTPPWPSGRGPAAQTPLAQLGQRARAALGALLDQSSDGELERWLALDLLAHGADHPLPRRLAAVELLGARRSAAALLALFECGVAPERALRDEATRALSGWNEESVHRFFLAQLEREAREHGWISPAAVALHFESAAFAPDSAAARALAAQLEKQLASEDWREAVRAARMVRGLPDELAFPALIAGLSAWVARRETGPSSPRVEGELSRELERRSGRPLGPRPRRWAEWWKVRGAGEPVTGAEPDTGTRVAFFGLRPMTDRICFVIDDSGSMEQPFGAGERSRYEVALEQLEHFVRGLGPRARFRVVLFSDGATAWRESLAPADERWLAAAQSWLAKNPPHGNTQLRAGIESALHIGPDGRPDLESLEEDTVLVLCDGETAEGPHWIAPFWERAGFETGVVFYSVQIGGGGDGALQELARLSGGEFQRVDG